MSLQDIREWIQAASSMVSLLLIVFGLFKVFNRQESEWKEKERRLTVVETDVKVMKDIGMDVVAIRTKMSEIVGEITRVRDRLDSFLDAKGRV